MKSFSKCLLCRKKLCIFSRSRIVRKNWCSSKAKKMILFEISYNRCMHISKLTSMTLIKNNNDMLIKYFMLLIFLNEC